MKSIEQNIEELRDAIFKLNQVIQIGEAYIRAFDTITYSITMDEVPKDVREYYLKLLQDVGECKDLKGNLEAMLHIASRIGKSREQLNNRDIIEKPNVKFYEWIKSYYKFTNTEETWVHRKIKKKDVENTSEEGDD